MNQPVTVYIPAYNVAEYLPRCIQAVQAQTHPVAEIVVIDDGSNDDGAAVAEGLGARVIPHGENQGLAQGRRTAFDSIETPFIASLDADCEPEPTWLATLMRCMRSPSVAGAGGVLIERHRTGLADAWRSQHMQQTQGRWRIDSADMAFGNNNVFRREAVLAVGSYPTDPVYRTNNEDFYLSRRLRERGWQLVYEPAALVFHNRRDSISSLNRTYWRWWFLDRIQPNSPRNLLRKSKQTAVLATDYARVDLKARKWRLLWFDLVLLPLYQAYHDLVYYRDNQGVDVPENRCP